MKQNLINSQCDKHKKMCEYMCCYSKCQKRLICQKCKLQHIAIHPTQFIYQLTNLSEVHAYNKIDKLKQILIKQKIAQETIIKKIYKQFQGILTPLSDKVRDFAAQSKAMIQAQLSQYLRSNKYIIDQTEKQIIKSDTKSIKHDPNKMLQQTINQTQVINRREGRIVENGQSYKWYSDTCKQMCAGVVNQIQSMSKVIFKLISNSIQLQKNKFSSNNSKVQNHHQLSFFKRYHASVEVGIQRVKLEGDILQSKKVLNLKQNQILKSKKQIRDKVIKISELQQKIQGLSQQLQQWQQKKQRQQRQKMLQIQKQKKMKQQMLIKNGIIGSNGKSLCFQRKQIDESLFPLILQLVPNPITLDISNHKLSNEQLQLLLTRSSIQILKYNFARLDIALLKRFLRTYQNLVHLQLNSCDITDNQLQDISKYFSTRLKILYIIDNAITDQGLQMMYNGMQLYIQQLYLSYNRLNHKTIQTLQKHAPQLRVLHIAKTQIKQKGCNLIGKHMKNLQQLFVGATGINKQSLLLICKNCTKMKRLSLVANKISTEVVTQILLGLKQLQWLDLSYCNLGKDDIQKVQKLKIFNKELIIIFGN